MPDLTTKDALLERMVAATDELATDVPKKIMYQKGDTVDLANVIVCGYLTNGAGEIDFFIPLPKQIGADVTTVTVSDTSNVTIRGVNNYLNPNGFSGNTLASLKQSADSLSASITELGVYVTLLSTSLINTVNNTVVTMIFNSGTLTFG